MKKLFAVFLLAVAACQTKPNLEAEVAAIKAAAEAYHSNASGLQFDALAAMYAADATVMPPGSDVIKGAEAIQNWINGFKTVKNFKVSFTTAPEVTIDPDGDSGFSTAVGTLSYEMGGMAISETVRDFHVWKKQSDGSWKVAVDIWNEILPANDLRDITGVFAYLPPSKGEAIVKNGRFMFVYGPVDGKGPVNSRAGGYTLSGDTVNAWIQYSSDPKLNDTKFKWMLTSWSGDTVSFNVMDTKGVVTAKGRGVRVGR